MKRLRITVSGRVQGVGFRYFTERMAGTYNIKGYVRNLYNGDVEIAAIGEDKNMELFIDKVSQGPYSAIVTDVKKEPLPDDEDYHSFEITF
ncbi:MAG: acylphosphatase [Candidatus Cloacimonadota bacterium]|nr:MAG: acylphosphatase [Candidatus Cloacimonadota bacterium]